MSRTTAELVAGVLDVDGDAVLAAYIDTANQLVTDLCTASGYSDFKLELIERWLAAHFYATNRPRTESEAISGASEKYEPIRVDLWLWNTKYGQQAAVIDTAGNLAAQMNALKKVTKVLAVGGTGGAAESRWLGSTLE